MADELMAEMQALKDYVDITKMDKAKMKSAAALAADAMKPTTKFLADLDDMLWDQLKNVANTYIDKIGVADLHPTVGDVDYTATDVDQYLSGFTGVDPDYKKKLKAKPRLLNLIKKEFTQEEQAKMVGNPFLLVLLQLLGPLVIEWIKNWLSK